MSYFGQVNLESYLPKGTSLKKVIVEACNSPLIFRTDCNVLLLTLIVIRTDRKVLYLFDLYIDIHYIKGSHVFHDDTFQETFFFFISGLFLYCKHNKV